MSEAKLNLAQKIARVMGAVERVPKNGYNKFHGYHYATEGDVADTVRAALAAEGVAIIPSTEKVEWRDVAKEGKEGKNRIATVTVRYTITDGVDRLEAIFVGEGQDSGDKAIYKAYTGAHKYFLLRTFNISTGDDEDPEREEDAPPRSASPKRHEPKRKTEQGADASDEQPLPLADVKKKIDATKIAAELETCVRLIEALPEPEQKEAVDYYRAHKQKIMGKVTKDLIDNAGREAGQEG
jgi:hypothetical protein